MEEGTQEQRRWRDRKGISWLLRGLVMVVPLAAAIGASAILSRVLPTPDTSGTALMWWITVLGASTLVMHLTDRAARKLLPLALLMRLSLLFPDRAPSRVRVLRKAGSINRLAEALEDARDTGEEGLADAAERILALASALNAHDRRTRGHAERVRVYTDLLAEELDLDPHDRDRLRWASLLHDIGKLEVHPDILNKPGKPNDEEWKILRSHPAWGAAIVAPLAGWLGEWVLAVEEHHEKYDGTGYPKGLAGNEISFAARIVSVTDVFDVITSARSYQSATSPAAARQELIACAGTQFDPIVVRAFMNVSMGRMRWVMGPLSWLADVPFIGGATRLARDVVMFGGTAAAVATLVFTGLITPRSVAVSEVSAAEPDAVVVEEVGGSTSSATIDGDASSTTTTTKFLNEAPVAVDDVVTTTEDDPVDIDLLGNDSDPNGDELSLAAFDEVSLMGGTVSCASTNCTYTPPPDFSGDDQFTYTIEDGAGESDSATVLVTVADVNDAPIANSDSVSTPAGTSVIIYVLANDTDAEGEGRTIVTFDEVSSNGGAVACGTFCVYVPKDGFSGTDSFGYTIEDDSGNQSAATVSVTVG